LTSTKTTTRNHGPAGAGLGASARQDSKRVSRRFISAVSNAGNGSHFVCHFKPLGGGGASAESSIEIEDDPTVNIDDESREKTLNDRDNLVGLCTVKHYQFDTLRMAKFSTMMLLQHFLFPKFAPELTHRPVLSRQRSSRTGFGRQVTSEVASSQHMIETLSHPDDLDRRILGAVEADIRAVDASQWTTVEKSHTTALETGCPKPERVVRLLQFSIKILGLKPVIMTLLQLLPTDADVLGKVATVLKEHIPDAAFAKLIGA
jgi:hypothetical protein